ncbi:MAG: endonuclease/exonuclease/phosphatase family protein [Planctomycetes bacterium]|nr:endonuclease/exonuclease/phosphatase family protein [Planctomycetota bacterium]
MRVRPTNLIVLLAVPAMGAAAAPFVASWHWSLDLLACFPLQATLALAAAAIALSAARRWRPAILCALAGGLAAGATWRPLPGAIEPLPPPSRAPVLVVASLNVLRGNHANADRALAAVEHERPDVVFCSEVTAEWLERLAAGLPDFPHRCTKPDPGYYGAALFSRWPLRSAEAVPLGSPRTPAIRAIVDAPGGAIGLLCVHTPRPGNAERAANLSRALADVPDALAPLPAARVVLGDFNATPWNAGFRTMLPRAGLNGGSANGLVPTWPAHAPWPLRVPIDHVLCSPPLHVADARTGPSFGSDHLPLFATILRSADDPQRR